MCALLAWCSSQDTRLLYCALSAVQTAQHTAVLQTGIVLVLQTSTQHEESHLLIDTIYAQPQLCNMPAAAIHDAVSVASVSTCDTGPAESGLWLAG